MSEYLTPTTIAISKQANGVFDVGIYRQDTRIYYSYATNVLSACKRLIEGLDNILPLIGKIDKIRFYWWCSCVVIRETLKTP